ncbi:MAG: hypothetical protein AAF829_10520 [Pseudomonadota bacterium]
MQRQVILAAILAIGMGTLASADTSAFEDGDGAETASTSSWTLRTLEFDEPEAESLQVVYTSDPNILGAMITCNEISGLGVALATRPMDFGEAIDSETRRARLRTVRMTIEGQAAQSNVWKMLPNYGSVEPREQSVRNRVYNAIITGKSINLKISGRPDATLTFPEPDAAFIDFASECPATS